MELNEKVAFITGGASGLGKRRQKISWPGAKVMLFDLNPENAETAARELGENADWSTDDVSNENDISRAILKTKESFGALHINVNSAGISAAARTLGKNGMPIQQFGFVIVNP